MVQTICHLCRQSFAGLELLSEHYFRQHAACLGCKLCYRQYATTAEMDADFKVHLTGGLRMSCKYCLSMFGSVKKMQDHMDTEHADKLRRLTCKKCNYLACSIANFELHTSSFCCPTRNAGSMVAPATEDRRKSKNKSPSLKRPPPTGITSPKTPIQEASSPPTKVAKSRKVPKTPTSSTTVTPKIKLNCSCPGKPKFDTYRALYDHGMAEHRRTFTSCMFCGLAVPTVNDKDLATFHKRHRLTKNHDGRPLFCLFCGKTIGEDGDEQAVLEHVRLNHAKADCFCVQCQTYLPAPSFLAKHRCLASNREARKSRISAQSSEQELMFTPQVRADQNTSYSVDDPSIRQRHSSASDRKSIKSEIISPGNNDVAGRKRLSSSHYLDNGPESQIGLNGSHSGYTKVVPSRDTPAGRFDLNVPDPDYSGLDLQIDNRLSDQSGSHRKRARLTGAQNAEVPIQQGSNFVNHDVDYLNQLGQSLSVPAASLSTMPSGSAGNRTTVDGRSSNANHSARVPSNTFTPSGPNWASNGIAGYSNGQSLLPHAVPSTSHLHVPANANQGPMLVPTTLPGRLSSVSDDARNRKPAAAHRPNSAAILSSLNLPPTLFDDDDDEDSSDSNGLAGNYRIDPFPSAAPAVNRQRSNSNGKSNSIGDGPAAGNSSTNNNMLIMYVCSLCKIESKYRQSIRRHVMDVHRVAKELWELNCEAVERMEMIVPSHQPVLNTSRVDGGEEVLRVGQLNVPGSNRGTASNKSKSLQVRMDCDKCAELEEENRALKKTLKKIKGIVEKLSIAL